MGNLIKEIDTFVILIEGIPDLDKHLISKEMKEDLMVKYKNNSAN